MIDRFDKFDDIDNLNKYKYKIAEKFISINGEGTKAGQLAVFVRFTGCNLCCSYCDTSWANASDVQYEALTAPEIFEYISSCGVKNITLTGGEPLLQDNINYLIEYILKDNSLKIEIETNGSVDISKVDKLVCRPSLTMDYKLPSSKMTEFMNEKNFEYIKKCDTVKFVAGTENDLKTAFEIINKFRLTEKCSVYLSPVFGMIEPSEIVEFMIKNKLNDVNLQLQMHKIIWEPNRKGV